MDMNVSPESIHFVGYIDSSFFTDDALTIFKKAIENVDPNARVSVVPLNHTDLDTVIPLNYFNTKVWTMNITYSPSIDAEEIKELSARYIGSFILIPYEFTFLDKKLPLTNKQKYVLKRIISQVIYKCEYSFLEKIRFNIVITQEGKVFHQYGDEREMTPVLIYPQEEAAINQKVKFGKDLFIVYDSDPLIQHPQSDLFCGTIKHPDINILFATSEEGARLIENRVSKSGWVSLKNNSELIFRNYLETASAFKLENHSLKCGFIIKNRGSFVIKGVGSVDFELVDIKKFIATLHIHGKFPFIEVKIPTKHIETRKSEVLFRFIECVFNEYITPSANSKHAGMNKVVIASHPLLKEMMSNVSIEEVDDVYYFRLNAYSQQSLSRIFNSTFLPRKFGGPLRIIAAKDEMDDLPLRCLIFGEGLFKIPDKHLYVYGDVVWCGGPDVDSVMSQAEQYKDKNNINLSDYVLNHSDPITLENFDELSLKTQYTVISCNESHGYLLSSLEGLSSNFEAPLYPLTRLPALNLNLAKGCVYGLFPHRNRKGLLSCLIEEAIRNKFVTCSLNELNIEPLSLPEFKIEVIEGLTSAEETNISSSTETNDVEQSSTLREPSENNEEVNAIDEGESSVDSEIMENFGSIFVSFYSSNRSVLSFAITKQIALTKIFEDIGGFYQRFLNEKSSEFSQECISKCQEELGNHMASKWQRGWFYPVWKIAHPSSYLKDVIGGGQITREMFITGCEDPESSHNKFVLGWFVNNDE